MQINIRDSFGDAHLDALTISALNRRNKRIASANRYIGGILTTNQVNSANPDPNRVILSTRKQGHLLKLLGYTERQAPGNTTPGTYEAKSSTLISLVSEFSKTREISVPYFFAPDLSKPSVASFAMASSGIDEFSKTFSLQPFVLPTNELTIGGNALTTRMATLAPWLSPELRRISPFPAEAMKEFQKRPLVPPFLSYLPSRRAFLFLDDQENTLDLKLRNVGFSPIIGSLGAYQSTSPAAALTLAAFAPEKLMQILQSLSHQWPFNFIHLTCTDIHQQLAPTEPLLRGGRQTKLEKTIKTNTPIDYDTATQHFIVAKISDALDLNIGELPKKVLSILNARRSADATPKPYWGFRDIETALQNREKLSDEAEGEVICRLIEQTASPIKPNEQAVPPLPSPPYTYDSFQLDGVAHMARGPTTIVSDDMGTGKTFQATAYADLIRKQRGHLPTFVLIVSQADQLDNWTRTMTLVPVEPFQILRLDQRSPSANLGKPDFVTYLLKSHRDPTTASPAGGALIVSYNTMVSQPHLIALPWSLVILDESHNIKTPGSNRTLAILGNAGSKPVINAEKMVWMTGTDITDTPMDLYPFISTAVWRSGQTPTSAVQFARIFCPTTKQTTDHKQGGNLDSLCQDDPIRIRRISRLAASLDAGPRIRRLKEHVYQHELIQKTRKAWLVPIQDSQVLAQAAIESRLFDQLSHDQRNTITATNHTLSFTEKREKETALHASRLITARAKIPFVVKAVKRIANHHDPILIFAHHTIIADELNAALIQAGVNSIVAHGKNTSPNERALTAYRFNAGEWTTLITTIAGLNAGHTITRTRHVWFIELDHKGKLVEQCEDRAWRRGQLRNVRCRYFHIKNSYDGRVAANILRKARIADIASGDDKRRLQGPSTTPREAA